MPTKSAEDDLLNIGRGQAIILAINRFCLTFFASAGIGVGFALMSALLLKYVGELKTSPDVSFKVIDQFSLQIYESIRPLNWPFYSSFRTVLIAWRKEITYRELWQFYFVAL